MVKKIVRVCDVVMEVTWLLALLSIPIYFNIFTSRVFEPDKITLFRTLALIMGVAWLGKWLAIWAADQTQKVASKRSGYYPSRATVKKDENEPVYEPDGEVVPPDTRPFPRNFLLKPIMLPALALVFVYALA